MIHKLKIDDIHLADLRAGTKRHEVRFNDRGYQIYDILEFSNNGHEYHFQITHIHAGIGLKTNYVALSVQEL